MLLACYSSMQSEVFYSLPNSTNAVESYNRFSKSKQPHILKVTMMMEYKEDMSKSLQVMARQKGLPINIKTFHNVQGRRDLQTKCSKKKEIQAGE